MKKTNTIDLWEANGDLTTMLLPIFKLTMCLEYGQPHFAANAKLMRTA